MHSPTIIINRVLGQCNPSHYFVLTFFPYLVEIDVLKLYNTLKIYLPRGTSVWMNLSSYLLLLILALFEPHVRILFR